MIFVSIKVDEILYGIERGFTQNSVGSVVALSGVV